MTIFLLKEIKDQNEMILSKLDAIERTLNYGPPVAPHRHRARRTEGLKEAVLHHAKTFKDGAFNAYVVWKIAQERGEILNERSVASALSKLAKSGDIHRVRRNLYIFPPGSRHLLKE